MSTKNKLSVSILFCIISFGIGNTQSSYQFGALPILNLNKKISDKFKVNFKTESRQIIYQEKEVNLKSELIDFSILSSTKIGLNSSLAGGYLLRIKNNESIHRLIQQFAITHTQASIRIAHRFSSDQTFIKEEDTSFRLRYRLSSQIPLSGQSVNPKEFYLKVSNEYLNVFQGDDYESGNQIRSQLRL